MRSNSPQPKLLIERGQLTQRFEPVGAGAILIFEDIGQRQPTLIADLARGSLAWCRYGASAPWPYVLEWQAFKGRDARHGDG